MLRSFSLLPRFLQFLVQGFHTVDQVLRRERISNGYERSDGVERSDRFESVDAYGRNQGFENVDEFEKIGAGDGEEPASRLTPNSAAANPDSSACVQLSISRVLAIVLISGPVYGIAMGSYAWVAGERSLFDQIPQMIYSGIKVPMLIGVTLVVSLPSFFIINSLMGLREDFGTALRSIVSAQAGLTIILTSLLPLTIFTYLSFSHSEISYSLAVLFNAAMFGVASVSAQMLLRGYYQPLVRKDSRHVWMIRLWILVYAFVGIQAGYVLRPFIGKPGLATSFLRPDSFQNAYVRILEMVWQILKSLVDAG